MKNRPIQSILGLLVLFGMLAGCVGPGAVTTAWTAVSGPGVVTFGNAAAVDTTASFDQPGTYVLRLTANDGELSASDDTSVTVSGAIPSNTAPACVGQFRATNSAQANPLASS